MEFDRQIRRMWLDRLSKNVRDWESLKRSINSTLGDAKQRMDYDEYLSFVAEWDQIKKKMDSMLDTLING